MAARRCRLMATAVIMAGWAGPYWSVDLFSAEPCKLIGEAGLHGSPWSFYFQLHAPFFYAVRMLINPGFRFRNDDLLLDNSMFTKWYCV